MPPGNVSETPLPYNLPSAEIRTTYIAMPAKINPSVKDRFNSLEDGYD